MEEYQIIQPSLPLAPYIKYYWIAESSHSFRQEITALGSIQLLFYQKGYVSYPDQVFSQRAILCGHITTPLELQTEGELRVISVVFHPCAAALFLNFPTYDLLNKHISVDETPDYTLQEIEKRVMESKNSREAISIIESWLLTHLTEANHLSHRRIKESIQLIDRNGGNISVEELSHQACLSYKQFNRLFTENAGIRPKDFIKTVRFQFSLFSMGKNLSADLTSIAYQCGYYDQSHFIHDFRQFTRMSPKEYLNLYTPYSEYFSV